MLVLLHSDVYVDSVINYIMPFVIAAYLKMSDRVKATIIGHSYIRRLHEKFEDGTFVPRGPPELFYNFVGVGGARVCPAGCYKNLSRWIPEVEYRRPDLVFLHCGENDIGQEGIDTFDIVEHLIKIIEEIVAKCHPRILIVSQLTDFPAHWRYGRAAKAITERLLHYAAVQKYKIQGTRLKIWIHTIGINDIHRGQYFDKGNVHLNQRGLWKYYKSVTAAVGRYARVILEGRKFE